MTLFKDIEASNSFSLHSDHRILKSVIKIPHRPFKKHKNVVNKNVDVEDYKTKFMELFARETFVNSKDVQSMYYNLEKTVTTASQMSKQKITD